MSLEKSHIADTINSGSIPHHHLDDFLMSPVITRGKLDADEYSAEDLDGVTESLFGSGNLNFLGLQAGQTNEAIALNDPYSLGSNESSFSNTSFANGFAPVFNDAFTNDSFFGGTSHEIPTTTDTDRSIDIGYISNVNVVDTDREFTTATVGPLGASELSSNIGPFASSSNLNLSPGDTTNIYGGSDQTNIINQTIENTTNFVNDTVQNTINVVNETIENVTNLGDEIIENILEGNISETVNIVANQISETTEIVNNILEDLGVTEIINVGDTVNEALNNETLNEVTEIITNLGDETISNVMNIVNDLLGDGRIALDLDGNALGSLGVNLGMVVDNTISGGIGTELLSGPATNMVHDLTGLNISFVADAGADIGFNLLNGGAGTGNQAGDSDVTITGLDLGFPDIALDPIEGIVGDIDIQIDVPEGFTNPDALVQGVGDLVGSLDNFVLGDLDDRGLVGHGADGGLGIEIFDNDLGQDFDVDSDSPMGQVENLLDNLDLGNQEDALGLISDVISNPAETTGDLLDMMGGPQDSGSLIGDVLEIVEDAAGHISDGLSDSLDDVTGADITGLLDRPDTDLEDALDLLTGDTDGMDAGGFVDGLDNVWTENIIGDGGLFGDVIDSSTGADILPDPIGSIAEGLGALDIPQDIGGGLGGLFG